MSPALADDDRYPSFDVGGLFFGDLYYVPSHHLPEGDGATGAVLRRAYLTFDADFSKNWFGRMRFEANQSGEFETYEYEVDFKDLYLGWNLGRHKLIAGLSPTLTYDVIEAAWGLRYLARTPLDLQGIPSRDTGVSIKGPINASGSLSYRAMLGLGVEFGSDSDDQDKLMGALNWKPAPGWVIDLYADFQEQPGFFNRTTLQAFVAHQTENLRWGVQYSNQDREDDPSLELVSGYAVGNLTEKSNWIGRIDYLLEPSPRGNDIDYLPFDPSARATMFLGGLEFNTSPHTRLTPNIVVIRYDQNDEGFQPETDVHLRLTLFVNFE